VSNEPEVEIELCCDGLAEAIDEGAVFVIPVEGANGKSAYAEGVLCEDGKTVIRINFCPFCGSPRGDEPNA
jgi:hypothetical protein